MRSQVELAMMVLATNLDFVLSQSVRAGPGSRTLPQWLTGILAVVGFLFLTFVTLLIKRVWCEKSKRDVEAVETKESDLENMTQNGSPRQRRDSAEMKTYTNLAMVQDEDRVTAM